jgi:hypothetical protein
VPKLLHIHHQILDDGHITQGGDRHQGAFLIRAIGGEDLVGLEAIDFSANIFLTSQGRATINTHGATATDSIPTIFPKRQRAILFPLNLVETVEDRGSPIHLQDITLGLWVLVALLSQDFKGNLHGIPRMGLSVYRVQVTG